MLEARRLNVYGKRGTRIVYVSGVNQTPQASPFKKTQVDRENAISLSPSPTRRALGRGRKVNGHSTSPRGSPKSGDIFHLAVKKSHPVPKVQTPVRKPLGLKSVTVQASPSIVYLSHQPPPTPEAKAAKFKPFIDSGTTVVKGISKNAKATKTSKRRQKLVAITNLSPTETETEVVSPPRKRTTKKRFIVLSSESSDLEEIVQVVPRRSTRGAKLNPIVISDDSNHSDDSDYIAPQSKANRKTSYHYKQPSVYDSESDLRRKDTKTQRLLQGSPRPVPTALQHIRYSLLENSPLTPLSLGYNSSGNFFEKDQNNTNNEAGGDGFSISMSELEASFEALNLTSEQTSKTSKGEKSKAVPIKSRPSRSSGSPEHLQPLLAECGQSVPHPFTAFIDTFPSHELHGSKRPEELHYRKIGEASFSEVFAMGDLVLKIIPLRDESYSRRIATDKDGIEYPQESDARDVHQEVIVTRSMGKLCSSFIKLLRTYVVVGQYPSMLLELWDQFDAKKKSENIRPDIFPRMQAYALLILPNGGPDLETYTFPIKTGWRQACSIFWQTAKALATAEELVSFEHRDLHWGQLLVKAASNTTVKTTKSFEHQGSMSLPAIGEFSEIQMDHPSHGVTVTIIDLGLARMNASEAISGEPRVHWTPLDDTIFEGEGDYQFDVYRMMRQAHNDNDWAKYRPITNVMWLHYLSVKLIQSKRLRSPGSRCASDSRERQCYACLLEIEQLLEKSVSQIRTKKSRVGSKRYFGNAGDVAAFARERGWIQ